MEKKIVKFLNKNRVDKVHRPFSSTDESITQGSGKRENGKMNHFRVLAKKKKRDTQKLKAKFVLFTITKGQQLLSDSNRQILQKRETLFLSKIIRYLYIIVIIIIMVGELIAMDDAVTGPLSLNFRPPRQCASESSRGTPLRGSKRPAGWVERTPRPKK